MHHGCGLSTADGATEVGKHSRYRRTGSVSDDMRHDRRDAFVNALEAAGQLPFADNPNPRDGPAKLPERAAVVPPISWHAQSSARTAVMACPVSGRYGESPGGVALGCAESRSGEWDTDFSDCVAVRASERKTDDSHPLNWDRNGLRMARSLSGHQLIFAIFWC